jgi:hypothetical protein
MIPPIVHTAALETNTAVVRSRYVATDNRRAVAAST